MSSIKLYCEGKKGSHDYDILSKTIEGLGVQPIIPIGSIRGAGAIIEFLESGVERAKFKMLFRDRDFDKAIPNTPILEQDTERKYCYFSYRNTIENYLFDEHTLFNFVSEQKEQEKYSIQNVSEAKNKLIEAAENIKHYQAVRHTMGYLRTGETNFGTKWTDKSGILPTSLDENYCKQKALEKIMQAKNLTEMWNTENFEEIYANFLAQFNDDFINEMQFLAYFQGKDFASSLKKTLPTFPIEAYYTFAKKDFDYTKFPDLVELRKLLEEKV